MALWGWPMEGRGDLLKKGNWWGEQSLGGRYQRGPFADF